nr:putative uncharacterized protein GUCA1ANB [Hydra vulgaris]
MPLKVIKKTSNNKIPRWRFSDIVLRSLTQQQKAKFEQDSIFFKNSKPASLQRNTKHFKINVPNSIAKAEIYKKVEKKQTTPLIQRNKIAPFTSLGKPTCGFGFSFETNNRKEKIGIMPSNLVKWRSQRCKSIQVQRQK